MFRVNIKYLFYYLLTSSFFIPPLEVKHPSVLDGEKPKYLVDNGNLSSQRNETRGKKNNLCNLSSLKLNTVS